MQGHILKVLSDIPLHPQLIISILMIHLNVPNAYIITKYRCHNN